MVNVGIKSRDAVWARFVDRGRCVNQRCIMSFAGFQQHLLRFGNHSQRTNIFAESSFVCDDRSLELPKSIKASRDSEVKQSIAVVNSCGSAIGFQRGLQFVVGHVRRVGRGRTEGIRP